MKILLTGVAGFIGFHTAKQLIDKNFNVIGVDNLCDYYDVDLKKDRLKVLGINFKSNLKLNTNLKSSKFSSFNFFYGDLNDKNFVEDLFKKFNYDIVLHLAAQPGVRYSITNPREYINSNILAFFNVIDCSRKYSIKNFIYASSSSVYGQSKLNVFTENDKVDKPVSLYAATKKSNELIAHAYSEIYGLKTIGLRFFTVYGPFGRPDMAYFSFTNSIINNKPIKIFNNGNLSRDFTFIDDIVNGILSIIKNINSMNYNYKIYNIGNGSPVKLLDFISCIEKSLGKIAIKDFVDMQLGDVYKTSSNIESLKKDFNYKSKINIETGVKKFINWYKKYYKI